MKPELSDKERADKAEGDRDAWFMLFLFFGVPGILLAIGEYVRYG